MFRIPIADFLLLPTILVVLLLAIPVRASAQSGFVRVPGGLIALTNVDVIDGTGTSVKRAQTVVIDSGRIAAVGPVGELTIPGGAQVLDLPGRTVIPGLVGMHNHLFYVTVGTTSRVSAPRTSAHLYLAAGVTSIRTAGTLDLAEDIALKQEIDAGREAGPKIHLSSPYLGAAPSLPALEAAVEQFANAGVTTMKADTDLRRAELETVIRVAKRRGLKVTGHLCAVGFRDAAAMGIDNLEHGIMVNTEFLPGKPADDCPAWEETVGALARMSVSSAPIQETIKQLVAQGVAVTSTLAMLESLTARTAFFDRRVEPLLVASAWTEYLNQVQHRGANPQQFIQWTAAFGVELAFERRFVEAGGVLMAGADPTGWGGVFAGFADQRNMELLVEAGFTPEQAIQIATANGAAFLGESARIGTIESGKQADLVVIRGTPAARISDIRNVELVFKDGVGYDPEALRQAEYGNIGTQSWGWWAAVAAGPLIVLWWIYRRIVGRRQQPAYTRRDPMRRR